MSRPNYRKIAKMKMKGYKRMNYANSLKNVYENRVDELLKENTDYTWTRQAQWGNRFFDFWSHDLGIAIEVDGVNHKTGKQKDKDEFFDHRHYHRSGILTLRIQNVDIEDKFCLLLDKINKASPWICRRAELCCLSKIEKKKHIGCDCGHSGKKTQNQLGLFEKLEPEIELKTKPGQKVKAKSHILRKKQLLNIK